MSNSLDPKATEGVLFVYDVANRKLLGEFEVDTEGINDPEWIAGITEAPDGKFWGLVDETLFNFSYDRQSNTMSFQELYSVQKDGVYINRATSRLFARPLLFG